MFTVTVRVAGVSFPNADGSDRQVILRRCQVDDPVTLHREWANAHDPNAIAVTTQHGQIGYVPRHISAMAVKSGFARETIITAIRGGTPSAPTLGCEIIINGGKQP